MPLGAGLMSQREITYGVRGILGTVDSDNPLEKVVLRDQINLHVFRRLQLEVRKLLDCCEHGRQSWLGEQTLPW